MFLLQTCFPQRRENSLNTKQIVTFDKSLSGEECRRRKRQSDSGDGVKEWRWCWAHPSGSRSRGRKRKQGSEVSAVSCPFPVSNIKSPHTQTVRQVLRVTSDRQMSPCWTGTVWWLVKQEGISRSASLYIEQEYLYISDFKLLWITQFPPSCLILQ